MLGLGVSMQDGANIITLGEARNSGENLHQNGDQHPRLSRAAKLANLDVRISLLGKLIEEAPRGCHTFRVIHQIISKQLLGFHAISHHALALRFNLLLNRAPRDPRGDEGAGRAGKPGCQGLVSRQYAANYAFCTFAKSLINFHRNGGRIVCEACNLAGGDMRLFDAHHLEPLATGIRESRPEDFAVLCPTCHRWAHCLASDLLQPLSVTEVRVRRAENK